MISNACLCDRSRVVTFSTEANVSKNYGKPLNLSTILHLSLLLKKIIKDQTKEKINNLINKPQSLTIDDVKKFIVVAKTDEDCDLLLKAINA